MPPAQRLVDDGPHYIPRLVKLLILCMFVVPDELYHLLGTHDVPQPVRRYDYVFLHLGVERVYVHVGLWGDHKLSVAGAVGPEVAKGSRDAQERN